VFGRLGFAGRLMAILLLAVFVVVAANALIGYLLNRQTADGDGWTLLPERAAAVIELFDRADVRQRELVLKAINSETVVATFQTSRPKGEVADQRLPNVEWIVSQFLYSVGKHEVLAFIEPKSEPVPWRVNLGRLQSYSRAPLKIAVSLSDGNWIVFETRVEISPAVFGIPPGFFIGAIGALVGIAALVAIAREAKPLRDLAASVSSFAVSATPQPVKPRGAPEVAALMTAVNEMQSQIAALVKGRTILLGAISHDLKTYITRLRLRAEGIADPEQYDKATRDLDDMSALIDDALTIAKSGASLDKRERIDLAALLSGDIVDRTDDRISYVAPSRLAPSQVEGDRVALQRLFNNLIDNALRHAGTARVSFQSTPERVVVVIDDDGPGIPVSERSAVFEPFYRLDPSRSSTTGGSGLGLAIAKQICSTHDGHIWIDASPTGGARLVVSLPMAA